MKKGLTLVLLLVFILVGAWLSGVININFNLVNLKSWLASFCTSLIFTMGVYVFKSSKNNEIHK